MHDDCFICEEIGEEILEEKQEDALKKQEKDFKEEK